MNQETEKVVGQHLGSRGCLCVGVPVLCVGMTLQGEGLWRWHQLVEVINRHLSVYFIVIILNI